MSIRLCPCGNEFPKVTNKRWCRQSCPARKTEKRRVAHAWYLRTKAKPYDPNGICACGKPFVRRANGGREQNYCSAECRGRETAKKWRVVNPERRHAINRKSRLKRHNLTEEHYLDMLKTHGAKCAICQSPDPGWGRKRRYLNIDHCHSTGTVRGLLCNGCNAGLGSFRDRADLLRHAADYLERSVPARP